MVSVSADRNPSYFVTVLEVKAILPGSILACTF